MDLIITNKNREPPLTEYLSLYIIPLYLVFFIFYTPSRPYLFISLIVLAIMGELDSLLRYFYFKNLNFNNTIKSKLAHSLILLIAISTIYKPPVNSHLLLIFAIIIIKLLPKWPYVLKKNYFILLYCLIYIFVYLTTDIYLKN